MKKILLILSVIIVIIIGARAFWVYRYANTQTSTVNISKINTTTLPGFSSAPTIISPSTWKTGTTVVLKGSNFPINAKNVPIVYIGSTQVTEVSGIISYTSNSITLKVPSISAGTYSMYVVFTSEDVQTGVSFQTKSNIVGVSIE